ncbi:MAG: DUF748 domain-containing protein [Betaproteobacteria bacterium]
MEKKPASTLLGLPRKLALIGAATVAALVLLYTVGGFVLLPWYAQRELPRLLEQQLHRPAKIGAIRFNPFTLTLEADDFALTEQDGRPLVSFKRALIDLEWRSIAQRAVVLGAIRLQTPAVHIGIAADGSLNLAALGGKKADAAQAQPAKPASPPRVTIGELDISNGSLSFADERVGYKNRFEELSFKLSALSTFSENKGPYALTATTPGGATLKWQGEASVTPLAANGTLALEHSALAELQPLLKNSLPGTLSSGRASVELPYEFALAAGKPQLTVRNGKLSIESFALDGASADKPSIKLAALNLDDLAVDFKAQPEGAPLIDVKSSALALKGIAFGAAAAGTPVFALDNLRLEDIALHMATATNGKTAVDLKSAKLAAETFSLKAAGNDASLVTLAALTLDNIGLDMNARAVNIGALQLAAPDIKVRREENGDIDLLKLFPPKDEPPSAPWLVGVKQVEISGGAVALDDRALGLAPALKDVRIKLGDVTNNFARPVAFDIATAIVSGGTLSARGRAAPGGAVEAEINGAAIALAPLQTFVARQANVVLASGEMAFAGKLKTGGAKAALSYQGSAGINNLKINDPAGVLLAGWKSLATTTLRVQTAPTQIEIDTLHWQTPAGKFAIAADRTTNFRRALKTNGEQTAATPAPATAAAAATPPATSEPAGKDAFALQIRRVEIKDGALDFSDETIGGGFATGIQEFNGTINGISTDRSTRSQLAIEGRVDEFGFVRVSGSLNPFQPRDRTNVRLEFRNLDMPKVTPYAVRFAGYKVASGRMSLDLNYSVRNNLIEGNHRVLLDQFTLGEQVDSPGAMSLPLRLAIAILKDDDGKIDLAVPISGNLDDPKFDYGGVIRQAIFNILTSIVTAPFKLIGSLFGGGQGEEISQIAFDPGSARLLPPEREKLSRIVQALGKRPELKLQVPARYDIELDTRALRRAGLRRDLGRSAGLDMQEEDPPGPVNLDDARTRSAARSLFAERFSSAELDKIRAEFEAKAKDGGADAAKQSAVSVTDRMRRLTSGEPQVTDTADFYRALSRRLTAEQPLAADALNDLARKRATTIADALKSAGIDGARVTLTTGEPLKNANGKAVSIELALSAR